MLRKYIFAQSVKKYIWQRCYYLLLTALYGSKQGLINIHSLLSPDKFTTQSIFISIIYSTHLTFVYVADM